MASFGSFETEREVYSDPIYTVYTARKQGDPDGEYAVKVFPLLDGSSAADLGSTGGGRAALEEARQSSISVQETASAVSKFVAPVLERGSVNGGVWYATRFYPRSVNKMMSGKVALPRASLEHILGSIAQGALDMKRACGRSHGDIRPTYVQVSKTEKLTEAEVVICDPMPGGEEQAAHYELEDLHAIGLILLQLVRQRMISREDAALMLPISPGVEWTRVFGSDASDWLALCNRLLDPGLSPQQFGLEALVSRLDELKPKGGGSRKLVLAGAVAAAVLVGVVIWWLLPRTEMVSVTSDPPGASLLVDGVKQAAVAPLKLELRRGNHVIRARQDEFELAEQATNCVIGKASSAVHFQFVYGSVVVRSDPPGATVLRGGVSVGKTMPGRPFTVASAPPGPVKYRLTLDQYEPAEVTGVVSNQQKLVLQANLKRPEPAKAPEVPEIAKPTTPPVPPPSNGFVELRANLDQAVILDPDGHKAGVASGDAPLRIPLPVGPYVFTAHAEGLVDVAANITVRPAETTQHTFEFDYGTVDWSVDPASATVSADGKSPLTPAKFVQRPGVPTSYVIRASGYRTITNEVTVQKGEHKPMVLKLVPVQVSLGLVSDPPGAEFAAENGTVLLPNETNKSFYYLKPGPVTLVARIARLGALTNRLEVTPDKDGSSVNFKFDYGILVLTNLAPDAAVYEGETPLGTSADKWVHQKPGPHTYAVRRQAGSQNVTMDISAGLNFLKLATAERTWTNSLGMLFAWVPRLPGGGSWPGQNEPGGWVGVCETTQGQYKSMDGSNPSFFRDGDNYPVENLTWEQAVNFCRWLSSSDHSERSGWQYALPTDEQFAAFAADADRLPRVTNEGRTGTSVDDAISLQRGARNPAVANLNSSRTHPEPVGSTRRPNQYGLYDVVGNVWEWLARPSGKEAAYAGGSYVNFSAKTVTAKARELSPEKRPNVGFRLILVPPQ